MTGRSARWLPPVLLLLPLGACSGDEERATLTVLAAASLTETFAELATAFEEDHPGVEVELVLGSSTALAEQVTDGAPGEVLATADERSMRTAADADVLAEPAEAFATNTLSLVTPPGNPAGIESLADLGPDVDFVVCAATAPCGALARDLLTHRGVSATPASEEVDVKGVLARVTGGEADAGLVYRTDAVAAGDGVTEVPLPGAEDYHTSYFVGLLDVGDDELRDLAAEFVTMVRSEEGRRILEDAGFGEVVRE